MESSIGSAAVFVAGSVVDSYVLEKLGRLWEIIQEIFLEHLLVFLGGKKLLFAV